MPRSNTGDALTSAARNYLEAYRKHFLTTTRPIPSFRAELDGPRLRLLIDTDRGVVTVMRRASAYLLWAGEFWGATQSEALREACPRLVAALTSHPLGGGNAWGNFTDFENDDVVRDSLQEVALQLRRDAPDESLLMLRRLFRSDEHYGTPEYTSADVIERKLPSELHAAVIAPSGVLDVSDWTRSTTPTARAKKIRPHAGSKSAIERLAVAVHLEEATHGMSMSNHLTYFAVADAIIADCLADGDGAIFEIALGTAQQLGAKLTLSMAFPEAKTLLDVVVANSVGFPETLRLRWECRLYDGDPSAEEDWLRAAKLDEPTDESPLGHSWFARGDVVDRRALVQARVAKALAIRGEGGDPCKHRKLTKKSTPTAAQRADALERARRLSGAGLEQAAPRIESDLEGARATGTANNRGFQGEHFVARAKIRESEQDVVGALADYREARRMRIAAGASWQIDFQGDDIRRLMRRAGQLPSVAPGFNPKWLFGAAPVDQAKAIEAWATETWRALPDTPTAAASSPIVFALLRNVVARSAKTWAAAEADGVVMPDRLTFADAAMPLLDAWTDRYDASHLDSALRDIDTVAFIGEDKSLERSSPEARRPYLDWVKDLASAPTLDAERILGNIDAVAWERVRHAFDEKVDDYMPLRDVFDAAHRVGMKSGEIVAVLRVFFLLLTNDWTNLGTPKPVWEEAARELDAVDGKRLGEVVIPWIRLYQSVKGYWGLQRLAAKWLWLFRYCDKTPEVVAFLADVRAGRLDNGKPLSKKQKENRASALGWIEAG